MQRTTDTEKQFVTKDNYNRYKKLKAADPEFDQSFESYNRMMIEKEYLGYMLYGLTCEVPKSYISVSENDERKFNVEFLQNAVTLKEYLGLSHISDQQLANMMTPHALDASTKQIMQERLQQLKGIGAIIFMAILLGDRDVFGVILNNVLVVGDTAIKIDPSEVKIPMPNNELNSTAEAETYSKWMKGRMDRLTSENIMINFILHNQAFGGTPYLDFLFKLLSEEQLKEGISMLTALHQDEKLLDKLTRIVQPLGYQETTIAGSLRALILDRGEEILKHFTARHDLSNSTGQIKNRFQTTTIKPENHFLPSEQQIFFGTAKPMITAKVVSEKRQLFTDGANILINLRNILENFIAKTELNLHARNELKELMNEIAQKIEQMSNSLKSPSTLDIINSTRSIQSIYSRLSNIEAIIEIQDILGKNKHEFTTAVGTFFAKHKINLADYPPVANDRTNQLPYRA